MAKRVTISVPDELHEKMNQWRTSFNFSKIFQRAVSSMIQKRESFQEQVRNSLDLTAVVTRLRKEKQETESDYSEKGRRKGLAWSRAAHYQEIQYALAWEPDDHPTRDAVLGDYFEEAFKVRPPLNVAGKQGAPETETLTKAFVCGWQDGVREFWNEVKDRI
ncbi:MAG: hypothetical protein JEZ11_00230 [Desulfobacterales bacterium]|nr:hypothetical protein [Desulfobacterales bacterium]